MAGSAAAGFFGLVEGTFWSLNALAVQAGHAMCREALSQLTDKLLPLDVSAAKRAKVRSGDGRPSPGFRSWRSWLVLSIAWPSTRLYVEFSTIRSVYDLVIEALANSIALVAAYVAVGALVWAFADASMPQPLCHLDRHYVRAAKAGTAEKSTALGASPTWSHIHVVGDRDGFRIEVAGRARAAIIA